MFSAVLNAKYKRFKTRKMIDADKIIEQRAIEKLIFGSSLL